MDDFKYRTVFAAKVKAIEEPAEEIKNEAKASLKEASASLVNLRALAADIKPEDDPDILYVVANLAVAGKVNLNDDAMTTEDALAVYKKFEKKFVDIEHNRSHVCGYIVKAGLSEFGTDRVITEEEAAKLPYFNVTTVSALWKAVNRPLCNLISESSNPESPYFREISLSFEVGFDDYEIGVGPKGDRNLSDVKKVISGGTEFQALAKRLKANDGNGLTEDGTDIVYRILGGNMIPLGQGIVTVPAAQVKGMEVIETPEEKKLTDEEIKSGLEKINNNLNQSTEALKTVSDTINKIAEIDEKAKVSSEELVEAVAKFANAVTTTQNLTPPVIAVGEEKNIKTENLSVSTTINANKTMKYNTLEEIEKNWANIVKPEVATDVSFAGARELFTAAIVAESKRLAEEAEASKKAAAKAEQDAKDALVAQAEAQRLLGEVKAELNAFKVRQAEAEAQAKFEERMNAIVAKFDFTDDERAIVVAKIRNLSDEEFKAWGNEADLLYKEKTKTYKQAKANELKEAIKNGLEKAGFKAPVGDKDVDFAEIFASVKVEDAMIHNRLETTSSSMKDLLTKAFGNVSLVKEKKK